MVALCAVAALLLSGPCRAQTASPGGGAPTSAQPESPKPPAAITGLTDTAPVADPKDKKHGPGLTLGLSDDLVVLLDGDAPLVPSDWVLYLDGKALPDLAAMAYDSGHGLVYRLQRTADDRAVWTSILGAPTDTTRPVKVSVARKVDGNESPHLLPPASNASVVFRMNILWTWWVWFAAVLALGTLFAMGVAIVKTPVLRDDVLPQLPWELRQFSLGRCQRGRDSRSQHPAARYHTSDLLQSRAPQVLWRILAIEQSPKMAPVVSVVRGNAIIRDRLIFGSSRAQG